MGNSQSSIRNGKTLPGSIKAKYHFSTLKSASRSILRSVGLRRVSGDQDISVQDTSVPGSQVKDKHPLIWPNIQIS